MSKTSEDTLEKAAGADMTMKLGDKTYTIKPYTIGDYIAFRQHIKTTRIAEFLASAEGMPPDERARVIVDLSSRTVTEEELLAESTTPEGMLYMLWRGIQKSDPSMTFERMSELIDEQSIEDLAAAAQGLAERDADENPTPTSGGTA